MSQEFGFYCQKTVNKNFFLKPKAFGRERMKVAALEKEELESSDLGREKGWRVLWGAELGFIPAPRRRSLGDRVTPGTLKHLYQTLWLITVSTSLSWVTPTRIQMCSGMFQFKTTAILNTLFLLTCIPVAIRFPTVDHLHCPCCALPRPQPSLSVPLHWSRGGDTAQLSHPSRPPSPSSGHATSLSYSTTLTV